jgi:hypothetical protein
MFAINRTTIKSTYNNKDRINDLKVNHEHLKFIMEVEQFLEKNCPLPVTFDVSPCQNPYFSEYTYSDFSTAVWIKSLSNEFNTRYFMDLPKDIEGEIIFNEKYNLILNESDTTDRIILFLAGTNLFEIHAWEIIDRIMYLNDKALIKTHPLTKDESLKKLGNRYGWHRILGPMDSGYGWYDRASSVYTTSNSELMVRSLIDNKFKDCLTSYKDLGKTSYMPFLMLHNKGYSSTEIKSVILSEESGIVFRNQEDWKERIISYFKKSMKFRNDYIAYTPILNGSII